ncbi:MAG: tetratricopeptide repeat protein [Bacteroidota bacterium]
MATPPTSPSASKRRVFYLIALSIPVLFFLALEVGLRLGGYGAAYPLFIPNEAATGYLYQNPDVGKRYFFNQAQPPRSVPDYFLAEKPENALRIVVQGGSSAAGYPYYHGGSFSRMLKQRLQASYPDRHVEVINTAMAAINSYTLLDFADEIIAQQPDAVLIYAGHNEYYGALGVGSSESVGQFPGLIRLYLRLHDIRTIQLLRDGLRWTVTQFGARGRGEAPGSTLMERMVAEQSIAYDSPIYAMGGAQFSGNMRRLLQRYADARIPVFVGTLASNERFKPFIGTPASAVESWSQAYRQGLDAASMGDTTAAFDALALAIAADSSAADAFYARARIHDALGQYDAAADAYVAAKDRDLLRFRAPEWFNALLREAADATGATVVETQDHLRANSPGSIIDDALMLEHLHPNLQGYFLIADRFYDALLDADVFGTPSRRLNRQQGRQTLLITPVDSLTGNIRVLRLMASWPFQPRGTLSNPVDTMRGTTIPERLALDVFRTDKPWLIAHRALANHYENTGGFRQAEYVWRTIFDAYPFLEVAPLALGNLKMKQQDYDAAFRYFDQANTMAPSPEAQRMLGALYIQRGDAASAIPLLKQSAEGAPDHAQTLYNLSGAYALTDQPDAARQTLQRLLEIDPSHEDGRRLLASLPR